MAISDIEVMECIAKFLKIRVESISQDLNLAREFNVEPITDYNELAMELEEQLNVSISTESLERMLNDSDLTVADIIAMCRN